MTFKVFGDERVLGGFARVLTIGWMGVMRVIPFLILC